MQQEIEVKFLNVDPDKVRATLKDLGAHCEHPMRLMRRIQFDYPDSRFQKSHSKRLRVRDEGNKITITYKAKNNTNYLHELETTIGSFEDMVDILTAIGLVEFSYQQSKRETWICGNTEVVIDEWPWVNPYIEIEGPDEESIMSVAAQLGFEWKNAKFGSVDKAYMAQYKGMKETDSVGDIPRVTFDMPVPQYFLDRLHA